MSSVLVVGGGIAGMQASLDIAAMNHKVYLVEKKNNLGGNLRNLYTVFPTNDKAENILSRYIEKINRQNNITVLKNSMILDLEGEAPAFKARINSEGKTVKLSIGAIVLATGFSLYNLTEKKEYGHDRYKNVISTLDLEKILKVGKLERPSDSKKPQSIVFVQCVGFRDVKTNEYCSSFCCMSALKNTILIKNKHPDIEIYIMYMDIRTPSLYEKTYSDARNLGVKFIRSRPSEIFEKKNNLVINFENTLTGKTNTLECDLVVLSVGAIPNQGTDKLSEIMDVPLSETGFFKIVSMPSGTGVSGIFIAGANCGPRDISYSRSMGSAAATHINKMLRYL
jgi:heterodisulfide reductase subunit A